jgi:hypothetical protein
MATAETPADAPLIASATCCGVAPAATETETGTTEPPAPTNVNVPAWPDSSPLAAAAERSEVWFWAVWSTRNVRAVGCPVPVAVAVTEGSDDDAASACQLEAVAALVAASPSEATFVLSDCSAVTRLWVAVCLVLSACCGWDSSCMSWLMMLAVSRPLTRPLTLDVPAISLLRGHAPRRVPGETAAPAARGTARRRCHAQGSMWGVARG